MATSEDCKSEPPECVASTPVIERECNLYSFAVAVCTGLISGLTIGQAQYAFGTFVGALAEEFPSWTRLQINTALSVGMIVNAVVSPLAGISLDRFSIRCVVPLAGLVCGLGWVCIACTNSLVLLYCGFALIYFSFPSNTMQQCGKIVGAWFPKSRGKVMGVVTAANNAGGVLMILLSSQLEWRTAAMIFAGMQFGAAILYFAVVRDAPPNRRGVPNIDDVATQKSALEVPSATRNQADSRDNATLSIRNARFWCVCLALCLCFTTYPGCLTQMYPALLADGVDTNTAAGCLSLVGALGVASKVASGVLADKIGAKRAMQVSLIIQMISMGCLVLHGSLSVTGRPLQLAWAAAGIYGVGFGAVGALIPLVTLEEYGVKVFGKVSGVQGFSFIVPGMVAPAIAGAFFDHTGQYTGAFVIFAGVFLVALILLELLCRTASAPLNKSSAVETSCAGSLAEHADTYDVAAEQADNERNIVSV